MRRTTVLLPDELKHELSRAAQRRGQSEADLIREAISKLVATEPPRPRPTIGFVEDGTLVEARDIDEAVADAIQDRRGSRQG